MVPPKVDGSTGWVNFVLGKKKVGGGVKKVRANEEQHGQKVLPKLAKKPQPNRIVIGQKPN